MQRLTPSCVDQDPEMFFSDRPAAVREAKEICGSCPLVLQCLTEQLDYEQGYGRHARNGIFGGTSPDERYAIEKRRQQAAVQERATELEQVA